MHLTTSWLFFQKIRSLFVVVLAFTAVGVFVVVVVLVNHVIIVTVLGGLMEKNVIFFKWPQDQF